MTFPQPHIISPTSSHTHTIILLHGRGSYGHEFASELFSLTTSQDQSLLSHFPSWRWVFPTSRERWSIVFEEELSAWFDIYSVADPSKQSGLQLEGLKESMGYILEVIKEEVELLDGDPGRLVLGGMSQGMAMTAWTMLCLPALMEGKVGAFMGFCGWLPFAGEIQDFLMKQQQQQREDKTSGPEMKPCSTVTELLLDVIGYKQTQINTVEVERMISTPALLLHGSDDAWVDVELGRQAHLVLAELGMHVDWNEYVGAENEGHWVKDPEGFDKIVAFLETALPEGEEGVQTARRLG